ncbi:PspC domain-containing protein [Corynebacterium sp. UBA2622]|uniref:PspC domain-containing protein n=1 Tax=Corynebacterium sp. UBA2622 TaxID=1946393 RepID=UPI0025BC7092|nr:PspC domain-containing protein [Corynebacterium sp. UBA2622]
MTTKTATTTIQEIWQTRPPRIPKNQGSNAVVGGVCEGIGARYQIDPVIVRLAFVALTLTFGGGAFLYLLLWLVMPVFGTTVSPWSALNTPKDERSPFINHERNSAWLLLAGLFIFFPSLSAGEGGWAAASAVSAVLAAAGIYLLHQNRPVPPAGLLAQPTAPGSTLWTPGAPTVSDAPRVDTTHLTVPEGFTHPGAGRATPPSWDPLGAAPELWHLPEPEPAEPAQPAPKPRRRRGLFLALSLIVANVAVFSVVWAVLSDEPAASLGDRELTVTDDLRDSYTSGVGTSTLDLSRLTPLGSPRTVEVNHSVGNVEITPPDNVRVELSCSAQVGTTACPGVVNPDTPGNPLRLNVHVRVGDITVKG